MNLWPFTFSNEASQPSGGGDLLFPALDVGFFVPYGEYPHPLGLQILDRMAATAMSEAFESLISKLRGMAATKSTFRSALPVYIGHPDDPSKAGQYLDGAAYAWITLIKPQETGVMFSCEWLADGEELIKSKKYLFFSPHWKMKPIPGRAKAFRPFQLISIGLTNRPNIPVAPNAANEEAGNSANFNSAHLTNSPTKDDMKIKLNPELKKALGLDAANDAEDMDGEEMANAFMGIIRGNGEQMATQSKALEAVNAKVSAMSGSYRKHMAGIIGAANGFASKLGGWKDAKAKDTPAHLAEAGKMFGDIHSACNAYAADMLIHDAGDVGGPGLGGTINLPAGFQGVAVGAPHGISGLSGGQPGRTTLPDENPPGVAGVPAIAGTTGIAKGGQAPDSDADPNAQKFTPRPASNEAELAAANAVEEKTKLVDSQLEILVTQGRVCKSKVEDEKTALLASNDFSVDLARLHARKPLKTASGIPKDLMAERQEVYAANAKSQKEMSQRVEAHMKNGLSRDLAYQRIMIEDAADS